MHFQFPIIHFLCGVLLNFRGKPYTYLSLVQKNSNCIEVLKGCIVTLVGKMGIADGLDGKIWTVKVSFTDGSGTVTASLAPKLVEDAFGFSPLVKKIQEASFTFPYLISFFILGLFTLYTE